MYRRFTKQIGNYKTHVNVSDLLFLLRLKFRAQGKSATERQIDSPIRADTIDYQPWPTTFFTSISKLSLCSSFTTFINIYAYLKTNTKTTINCSGTSISTFYDVWKVFNIQPMCCLKLSNIKISLYYKARKGHWLADIRFEFLS